MNHPTIPVYPGLSTPSTTVESISVLIPNLPILNRRPRVGVTRHIHLLDIGPGACMRTDRGETMEVAEG